MEDYLLASVERRLRHLVERVAPMLSNAARDHVEHYLEVCELEMACESFVLSIMEESAMLDVTLQVELLEVCRALQLDRQSVFRHDFWKLFTAYVTGGGNSPSADNKSGKGD